MPTFLYEAINAGGKPEKGRIEAVNSDEASAAVRQNGCFSTSVREEKIKGASKKAAKQEGATA